MSSSCDNKCSSCSHGSCGDRKAQQTDFREKPHELSNIKKVIGIVSGKGGVGKSLVTSMLAIAMNKRGYNSAILDADITGPSIPKAFGITTKATGNELGLLPSKSKYGVEIMSVNLLLENDTDPVVWRGSIISNTVKQFWKEVLWTNVDYMFVDMPPGTGDVPLTVFQSLPVDGIVIVTSPQELVSMIVTKAVKMANKMNIPIIGIVENMSYLKCPDCDKIINVFGESHIEEVAATNGIGLIAKIPIDPAIASTVDKGAIEDYPGKFVENIADVLETI